MLAPMKLLGWIGVVILIVGAVALASPERVHAPAWLGVVLVVVGLVLVFTGRK